MRFSFKSLKTLLLTQVRNEMKQIFKKSVYLPVLAFLGGGVLGSSTWAMGGVELSFRFSAAVSSDFFVQTL
jgi:hypothetical protein